MSKPGFKCGLVVGKFCPLHLGHERVIERALTACDEVLIISWARPGFAGYGREVRESWLKARFPAATCLVIDDESLPENAPTIPPDEAPDDEHRHFVAWLCREILCKHPDAVFTSEAYGEGFAEVLSTHFGKPVEHVCVDQARTAIPVSGTQIRSDPHAFSHYLAPEVYASFVQRICLLGGESTGKTTLAQALAARLDTVWAAEYGRELWDTKNGQLQFDDMLHIGQTQVQREEQLAAKARRFLICDTSPLTTLLYSQAMFGKVAPELAALAERPYDQIFLCAPDFDFVQDGTRRDEAFRQHQHDWYLTELAKRGIVPIELSGTLEQRLAAAFANLGF
ncbi:MAG: ATPase [Proteobacteria bacterium]|nr:ATPase [Pseudomonadota bacterium]